MLTFEQSLQILAFLVFFLLPLLRLSVLKRLWDARCFLIAYYISVTFFFLIFYSLIIDRLELVPQLISSLVVALLTLTLVWVELSKRPELRLLAFVPIIHDKHSTEFRKADYHGKLSKPSRFLSIREASFEDTKFDDRFSFAVDLANIGYEEILVHEYVITLDGERKTPEALLSPSNTLERLVLRTQQRYTVNMLPLHVEKAGFHKIKVEVFATTVKTQKEIWFCTSEGFERLRYVEMYPLKRLLSLLVRSQLKDP